MEQIEASDAAKCPHGAQDSPHHQGLSAPECQQCQGEWSYHDRDSLRITGWAGRAGMQTSLPDSSALFPRDHNTNNSTTIHVV